MDNNNKPILRPRDLVKTVDNINHYTHTPIRRPRNFIKAIHKAYIKRMRSLGLEIVGDETNDYKTQFALYYKRNGVAECHIYDFVSRNHK